MYSAIRTARYQRRLPDHSQYSRTSRNIKNNNGKSVLAKKIIVQSVASIMIIFFITWLQSKTEEYAQNIITHIRLQVVEHHIDPENIYESFADTYEECLQYIKGSN